MWQCWLKCHKMENWACKKILYVKNTNLISHWRALIIFIIDKGKKDVFKFLVCFLQNTQEITCIICPSQTRSLSALTNQIFQINELIWLPSPKPPFSFFFLLFFWEVGGLWEWFREQIKLLCHQGIDIQCERNHTRRRDNYRDSFHFKYGLRVLITSLLGLIYLKNREAETSTTMSSISWAINCT